MAGKLVLIIGPSGVGKSVVLKALKARHPEFVFPRSATTRPRRSGEGDELYHFVSDAQFSEWLTQDKFLETATVHQSAKYGTLLDEIIPHIEAGKTVIREVDVQGFESIREHKLFTDGTYALQTIFILPESEEQLLKHIQKRAPMSADELAKRRASMQRELEAAVNTNVQVKNIEGKLDDTIIMIEKAIG